MADPLRPPLHGVRVLELAHLIAGPICGMYLADMGADVVKVESREAPDAGRSVYPRAVRNGEGVLHLTVNRNKRGICLDVKQPEGRDAFLRLAGWADVIIEGFRGGVAERLGIDYDSVKGANPRLIYCSISAFGPDGPWREKPGLDSLAQALGCLMAITGEPDGGPVLCGAPVADTLGGMLAIQGILTALIARRQWARPTSRRLAAQRDALRPHRATLRLPRDRPRPAALRQRPSRDRALPGLPGRGRLALRGRVGGPPVPALLQGGRHGRARLRSPLRHPQGPPRPPRRAGDDPGARVPRAPGRLLDGGTRARRRALRA